MTINFTVRVGFIKKASLRSLEGNMFIVEENAHATHLKVYFAFSSCIPFILLTKKYNLIVLTKCGKKRGDAIMANFMVIYF